MNKIEHSCYAIKKIMLRPFIQQFNPIEQNKRIF